MNEQQIKALIQQEIQRAQAQGTFQLKNIPFHTHSNTAGDAPNIPAGNIKPGYRAGGRITMATEGRIYRIGLNFNATQIQFYGIGLYPAAGPFEVRSHIIGNAQLGPSYELLDDGTTAGVTAGGPQKSIIQGCASFSVNETTPASSTANVSQNDIIDVLYPNTSTHAAQARVINYGPGFAEIQLISLSTDWEIDGYFVVT